MRLGLFELVDPPDGQVSAVAETLDAIDYPWRRIIPAVRRDPDQAVLIRWLDTGQQANGLYYGDRIEIHLGTRYAGWERGVPFVLAHEIGHLVDGTTLTALERADLAALWHASPETYRRDETYLNGELIEYAHAHDHPDTARWWSSRTAHYYLMLAEAYADAFVEAFAPTIWAGRPRRFTHATADLETVRSITLRRPIMVYTDVPQDHPHREGIERAAELGLVTGYPDGSYRPSQALTRAQAATIAVRQYDRLREELAR